MAEERYRFELLGRHHNRAAFSSGDETLDLYFRERAGQDVRNSVAAVHIMVDAEAGRVAGFYTLSAAGVRPDDLPATVVRTLPRYSSLPATPLGRLALDSRYQGQGLGEVLLAHALRLAFTLSKQVAAMSVVVDAKDAARGFYRRNGFEPIVGDDSRLFIPMQRIAGL